LPCQAVRTVETRMQDASWHALPSLYKQSVLIYLFTSALLADEADKVILILFCEYPCQVLPRTGR